MWCKLPCCFDLQEQAPSLYKLMQEDSLRQLGAYVNRWKLLALPSWCLLACHCWILLRGQYNDKGEEVRWIKYVLFIIYIRLHNIYTLFSPHIPYFYIFLRWSIVVRSSWWNSTTLMCLGTFPAFPGFLPTVPGQIPESSPGRRHNFEWLHTYYISTVYVCTYFKCHMYTMLVHIIISNTWMILHIQKYIYIYTHVTCIGTLHA